MVLLNILLGIMVFKQNPKSPSNRLFSLLCLLSILWNFTNYLTDVYTSMYWLSFTYALGALVICVGLVWVLVLTKKNISTNRLLLILFIGIFFFFGSFSSEFITKSFIQTPQKIIFDTNPGWGLILYATYYLIFAFLICLFLYTKLKDTDEEEFRLQLRYILIGAVITLTITACTSLIFPLFSFFLFSGIDSAGFSFFLIFVAYSILKHHLFDIKVIATEIITFSLWIFMLARVILSTNLKDAVIEGSIFILTVILGVILIRSVLHEIKQRQKIENMAGELQEAYGQIKNLKSGL
ncbi:MAG: histidine kinase N-terminal 7TM domain-containing protein [bacterium]|nr:histidine kinase N-terminal 7TM domain-containing protein [bacterium]